MSTATVIPMQAPADATPPQAEATGGQAVVSGLPPGVVVLREDQRQGQQRCMEFHRGAGLRCSMVDGHDGPHVGLYGPAVDTRAFTWTDEIKARHAVRPS